MICTVTYTDDMSPDTAGYASLWRIYIRPAYKEDMGILAHETCHVRQFWRTLGFHIFLKSFKWYMLKIEIEAYREQLKYPPASGNVEFYRQLYAEFISTGYGLDITKEEAYKRLG